MAEKYGDNLEFFGLDIEGYEEDFGWGSITSAASSVGSAVSGAAKSVGKAAKSVAKKAKGVAKAAVKVVSKAAKAAAKAASDLGNAIKDGVKNAGKSLVNAVKKVGRFTKNLEKAVGNAMMKGVDLAIKGVKNGIKFVGKMAKMLLDFLTLHFSETFKKKLNLPFSQTFKGAKLSGHIGLEPEIYVAINIGPLGPSLFELKIGSSFGAGISAGIEAVKTLSIDKTISLASFQGLFLPIVPGIFITISPSLDLELELDVTGNLNCIAKADLHTDKPFSAGIKWTMFGGLPKPSVSGGSWAKSLTMKDTSKSGDSVATISAGIQLQLNILLEGLVGVFIGAKPFFVYSYAVDCEKKSCKTREKKSLGLAMEVGGTAFGNTFESANIGKPKIWDMGGASKELASLAGK
jgi:hypothetical protein